MLKETGRVLAVDDQAIWVETINRSTCGSCQARAGCGQSVLSRWMSRASHIRVLIDDECFKASEISVDDQVEIGIADDVVVRGSLLVYLLPLVMLLAGAWLGQSGIFGSVLASDTQSILGAILGFLVGGVLVRWHARIHRSDPSVQPILLRHMPKGIEPCVISSV